MGNRGTDPRLSRRTVIGGSAALGIGLSGLGAAQPAAADSGNSSMSRNHKPSIRAAVSFLQGVTDAYRTSGFRLAQSYQDNSGLGDIAFIYDNALTSLALLSSGDTRRARAIGDALLYAQGHDETFSDGRLRQAYHANTFVNPNGTAHFGWEFGLTGTAVGDMAWTGLALAHLARAVPSGPYLTGALKIGRWIVDHTYSTTGLGGYTFGETAGLEGHKSTEHNIDVYGFFRLLARLTGDTVWNTRAQHARDFVEAVWNDADGFFWTGSDDGAAINKNPLQLPLDVQAWSWLSLHLQRYASALDWAQANLATTDTPLRTNSTLTGNYSVTGVAFASGTFRTDVKTRIGGQSYNPYPDDGAVWFEGTGQLADALANRGHPDDRAAAGRLLAAIRSAQDHLGAGQTFGGHRINGGIVAASSPLDTGFGFGYFPNLHVAATSWYVFAATGFNPYRFG